MSSTLEGPNWTNSTVLKDHVVNKVSKLKRETDGDIVVYASAQLVRTLMEHDLVDELRLMIYPIVLGAGKRLFGETSDKKPMRRVHIREPSGGARPKRGAIIRDDGRACSCQQLIYAEEDEDNACGKVAPPPEPSGDKQQANPDADVEEDYAENERASHHEEDVQPYQPRREAGGQVVQSQGQGQKEGLFDFNSP